MQGSDSISACVVEQDSSSLFTTVACDRRNVTKKNSFIWFHGFWQVAGNFLLPSGLRREKPNNFLDYMPPRGPRGVGARPSVQRRGTPLGTEVRPAVAAPLGVNADSVFAIVVVLWTLVVAVGLALYFYSEHLKREKLESQENPEETQKRVNAKLAAYEAVRKKKLYDRALLRLWQSEPWKREYVGDWAMIEGSRQGFCDWIVFMGKSENQARKAEALPMGNKILCKTIDEKTLDQSVMRIDTTGIVNEGPWVQVGGPASEVIADKLVNKEKIFWDEQKRSLVRTRECPAAGYAWRQTRTISRGVMQVTVITTKEDGSSATFTMALRKNVV